MNSVGSNRGPIPPFQGGHGGGGVGDAHSQGAPEDTQLTKDAPSIPAEPISPPVPTELGNMTVGSSPSTIAIDTKIKPIALGRFREVSSAVLNLQELAARAGGSHNIKLEDSSHELKIATKILGTHSLKKFTKAFMAVNKLVASLEHHIDHSKAEVKFASNISGTDSESKIDLEAIKQAHENGDNSRYFIAEHEGEHVIFDLHEQTFILDASLGEISHELSEKLEDLVSDALTITNMIQLKRKDTEASDNQNKPTNIGSDTSNKPSTINPSATSSTTGTDATAEALKEAEEAKQEAKVREQKDSYKVANMKERDKTGDQTVKDAETREKTQKANIQDFIGEIETDQKEKQGQDPLRANNLGSTEKRDLGNKSNDIKAYINHMSLHHSKPEETGKIQFVKGVNKTLASPAA